MNRVRSAFLFGCLFLSAGLLVPVFSRHPLPAAGKPPGAKATTTKRTIDFNRQIAPIFAAHCVKCHGAEKQEGGLRLDHHIPALRGGDSGKLFVAGKNTESEIIKRVTAADEAVRMPPADKANKPLSKTQVATIRKWIDEGGHWPDSGKRLVVKSNHWAFQPIGRDLPPNVDNAGMAQTVRNGIDRFILARLLKHKLKPSPEADRYTLIKRLSYDLIGLPPTPEEVDAFVNDTSPGAYEKLVDRLLASKHFGERWGRHWLDKARYADSDGYEKDRPRLNAWRYRDWVIDAINRDMPFDRFTREQLAGDLLATASSPLQAESQLLATAFHRQTLTNTEGGTDKEQFRVEAIFDRVATTGTVWLGMTVGCAQCHTHKYDPITQAEYYQLFAFYNNGDETTKRITHSPAAVARYNNAKAIYDAKRKPLESALAAARKKLQPKLAAFEQQLNQRLQSQAKNKLRFHPIEVRKLHAKSGATLTVQKDGSVLVTGNTPDKETYTVDIALSAKNITGIRLEAMADKKLPNRGPGRTAHGNFVLTHIRADTLPASAKSTKTLPVKIAAAKHSFAQKKFPANAALDPSDRTGWAISPQMGKTHDATFMFAKPVNTDGKTSLRITLVQDYGSNHVIGKFRLTAITGTQPGMSVPADVLAALKLPPAKRTAKLQTTLLDYFANRDPEYKKLSGQLAALTKTAPKPPEMNVRVLTQRTSNPRKTHVLRRGEFLQPQAEVQPDGLAVLHPLKPRNKSGTPDRLDLANWLMDPANPLTPRVAVNHVWSQLFGEGLVATVNNFGVRGEKPSHPKLLDWLAREYMRGAGAAGAKPWSRKALIKLIVMSATYRQSSHHRGDLNEVDPQNRLLARQNRFRVQAETIRDIFLAASGLLSRKIGGPSVFPPMPADVAALSYAGNFRWKTSTGADRHRRGMYTFFKRTAPHPNLITFDCPDSNTTNVERRTSNTPLMALTTLNNIVFVESSQAMAKRVLEEKGLATDDDRIRRIFRLCVAREPASEETAAFRKLLKTARDWYQKHPQDAAKLVGGYQPKTVKPAEAAAWVATSRMMMNMDEFVTRE